MSYDFCMLAIAMIDELFGFRDRIDKIRVSVCKCLEVPGKASDGEHSGINIRSVSERSPFVFNWINYKIVTLTFVF